MKINNRINQDLFNEALLNSISDCIITTDLEGKIIYLNKAAEELYKWKSKEIIGKNILEVTPSTSTKKQAKEIMNSLKNGDSWEGEFEVQDKHGKTFPVHVKDSPLVDSKGNLIGIIGSSKDITKRKKIEQELIKAKEKAEKSEANVKAIIEGTNNTIWAFDREYKIIYINNTLQQEFYQSFGVLLKTGMDLLEMLPEQLKPLWKPRYDRVLANEQFTIEDAVSTNIGTVYIEVTFNPIIKNGEVIGGSCFGSDITERKNVEEEIGLSRIYLQNTVDGLTENIALLNEGGDILLTNRSWREFGLKNGADESKISVGANYIKACKDIHGRWLKEAESFGEELEKLLREDTKSFELEYPCDSSTERLWFTCTVSTFRTPNKRYILTAHRNITDQKKAELELLKAKEKAEESEKQLRLISDNFANGMIYQVAMLDENRRQFNYLSKNVEELYGCTAEEAKKDANLIYGKIHPDDVEGLIEKEKEALKKMTTFEAEARTIAPNGNIRWAYYISKPRKIDGVVCWDGIEIDVTERKQMELELIKAKEKAEEADRLKSAFLANMSHEIRTPMNGIIGFTNLLQEHDLTGEQQKQYIEIIQKSGGRMLNTVNDIIEISKIETGQIKVSSAEVNISMHLKSLYEFFNLEANNKELKLILDNKLSDDESLIITDKNKLSSILSNLIKNAIKFTDNGFIKIGCKKNKKLLELFVEDSGIGIPSDRVNAIFNRFEQADIEDKLVHEGSGLGLAITKSYVEMLGGNVWVESEINKGSTFFFTISYNPAKSDAKNESVVENRIPDKRKKLNILIVEDDATSSYYLSKILQDKAENIQIAKEGIEAVEICKKNSNLDLILMDVKLPGIDGLEASKRIRKFNKSVKIIAQTAHALEGDKEKAIKAGCDNYISKPIDKEKLVQMIEKYF